MIIIREQVFWLAGNTAIRLPGEDKAPVTVLDRVSYLQLRDSTGVAPVSLLPDDCRHSRNTGIDLFSHSSTGLDEIQGWVIKIKTQAFYSCSVKFCLALNRSRLTMGESIFYKYGGAACRKKGKKRG